MIPLILSASSIDTYSNCHYRWYLDNVLRLPAEGSVAMAIGSAVHAGAEVRANGGDAVDARDIAALELDDDLPDEPDEDFEIILRDTHRMLDVYEKEVLPNRHATMVERSIKATINGVIFSGVLDAADETTDTVYDLKTHSGKSPSFNPKKHIYQLTGYGVLYKQEVGRPAKRLMIDLITRTGKYRSYQVEPDVREFVDVLQSTAQGIEEGQYDPNGADAGRCRWCPYARRCEYAVIED